MNKTIPNLSKTVICAGLLLGPMIAHTNEYKLQDLLNKSHVVAMVKINKSSAHYAPYFINNKKTDSYRECHYTYEGAVEEVLKGSINIGPLSFSSKTGFTSGEVYLLFLDENSHAGSKHSFSYEDKVVTCPNLIAPVALIAMEKAWTRPPDSNYMLRSLSVIMQNNSSLNFPYDYLSILKYKYTRLLIPDDIERYVITEFDCTSAKLNKDGEIEITQDNIASECEMHTAQPFVYYDDLVDYIKQEIQ